MRRVLPILLLLVACRTRPKGQVCELGHVGDVKQIAVRGDRLYAAVMREAEDKLAMRGPIDLWHVDRDGGTPKILVGDLPPGAIAFGTAAAYIGGNDGTIVEIDLASGERKDRANVGSYVYALAEAGTELMVATEHEVMRVQPDGSRRETHVSAAMDAIVSDGKRIAATSIAGSLVMAWDPTPAPIGGPQNRPTCAGLTTSYTFWARDADGHKSELVGVARGGTAVEPITALDSAFPSCAAIGERIVVADERALRVVTPGEQPIKVATTGWVPALTVTDAGVYWVQMIASGWEIRLNRLPGD